MKAIVYSVNNKQLRYRLVYLFYQVDSDGDRYIFWNDLPIDSSASSTTSLSVVVSPPESETRNLTDEQLARLPAHPCSSTRELDIDRGIDLEEVTEVTHGISSAAARRSTVSSPSSSSLNAAALRLAEISPERGFRVVAEHLTLNVIAPSAKLANAWVDALKLEIHNNRNDE